MRAAVLEATDKPFIAPDDDDVRLLVLRACRGREQRAQNEAEYSARPSAGAPCTTRWVAARDGRGTDERDATWPIGHPALRELGRWLPVGPLERLARSP